MKSLALAWVAWFAVAPLGGILLLLAGCEVTPEKIQVWKESENGAPKLRAAVRDTEQPASIRVLAADALAELGHFAPLKEDLHSLGAEDRRQLETALVKKLLARMEGVNARATTRVQEQAKDSLFTLRGALGAQLRDEVDLKVLRWLLADWSRRRGGDHAGEKIATAIGAPAVPLLVAAIPTDPSVVSYFGELLRRMGTQPQREEAAAKMVELAKEKQAGKCPRCPEIPVLFEALGQLGANKGRQYLLSTGVSGSGEARVEALAALTLLPHPGLIDPMAAIAADPKEEGVLRDAAVAVIERVGGDLALRALLPLLSHKEKLLRYRAGEAMIACCGAQGVAKLLESLPSRYTYSREDIEDFIQKDVQELGEKALPPLRAILTSQSWWLPRAIAVKLLGEMGTKEDVPRLTKVVNDRTRLPWGKDETLGTLAQAALKRLRERLSAM